MSYEWFHAAYLTPVLHPSYIDSAHTEVTSNIQDLGGGPKSAQKTQVLHAEQQNETRNLALK